MVNTIQYSGKHNTITVVNTIQDETRQDKTRQDKTRQDKIMYLVLVLVLVLVLLALAHGAVEEAGSQYNTIYNTIQHHTIPYNTMQYNKIPQYNTIQIQ